MKRIRLLCDVIEEYESIQKKSKQIQKNNNYKCHICNRNYTSNGSLNRHINAKHKDRNTIKPNYSCIICDSCYTTLSSLNRHLNDKHKNRHIDKSNYKCSICNNNYVSPRGLNRHMNIKHKNSIDKKFNHKCNNCGNMYTSLIGLNIHLKAKHNISSKSSNQSKKDMPTIEVLKFKNDIYRCTKCDNEFIYKTGLDNHMIWVHGPATLKVRLKNDYKNNNYVYDLNHYNKTNKYKCIKCDYEYTIKSSLTSHFKRKHT